MRVLGMISGTSLDGVDAAVVRFDRSAGALTAQIEYSVTTPYPAELRADLVAALPPAEVTFAEVCRLDTLVGQAFADAAARAQEATGHTLDAVCTHGQTVFHWVQGGTALGTLQIGQPAWIAERTGLPVVSDVRAADLAAGGQGAPLVPLLDERILAAFVAEGRVAGALNLGGIANLTRCAPDAAPRAWDVGPANALVDAVVTASPEVSGSFDRDGALAAAGSVHPALLAGLLAEPYYALPAPKSSGKELFNLASVRQAVEKWAPAIGLADLVATLTELTARTVADAVHGAGIEVLVPAGGGVHNPVLMSRLAALLPEVRLVSAEELGVPTDGKEAVAFALMGWATLHGLPANVPSCTGASGPRILGRITPAPRPGWALPEPLPAWPDELRFVGAPEGAGA
jgi:anhydro-N-acetylmuramic acid kinase